MLLIDTVLFFFFSVKLSIDHFRSLRNYVKPHKVILMQGCEHGLQPSVFMSLSSRRSLYKTDFVWCEMKY